MLALVHLVPRALAGPASLATLTSTAAEHANAVMTIGARGGSDESAWLKANRIVTLPPPQDAAPD